MFCYLKILSYPRRVQITKTISFPFFTILVNRRRFAVANKNILTVAGRLGMFRQVRPSNFCFMSQWFACTRHELPQQVKPVPNWSADLIVSTILMMGLGGALARTKRYKRVGDAGTVLKVVLSILGRLNQGLRLVFGRNRF